VNDDPRELVREGYDVIASRYLAWNVADVQGSPADDHFVPRLLRTLQEGAHVLDLGCGNGVPRTRALTTRFVVVGVDLSWAQLSLAREHAPGALLVQADMSLLHLRPAAFDAAVALYSIIHVPREKHHGIFRRVAAWLRPGGLFVVSLGTTDVASEFDEDWLGAPMYWSSYDADTNIRLVWGAGFELIESRIIGQVEDGEDVDFQWIVARKPTARPRNVLCTASQP
jgi:SAM-dependent methyltransferase